MTFALGRIKVINVANVTKCCKSQKKMLVKSKNVEKLDKSFKSRKMLQNVLKVEKCYKIEKCWKVEKSQKSRKTWKILRISKNF